MDREKVIKGLEETKIMLDKAVNRGGEMSVMEAYKCFNYVFDALALLKEQEAVEPEKEHSGSGITWWNVCGNCKTAINPNDKYCHECGRAVKW